MCGAEARYDGRLVVTTRSLDRRARGAFRRHLRARLAWIAREALCAADRTRHDHRRRQSELLGVQPDTRSAPAERASAGAGREPCGGERLLGMRVYVPRDLLLERRELPRPRAYRVRRRVRLGARDDRMAEP